ncbi:MAG TPA: DUF4905 domain-containing protein [Pedobacter sp.]
MIWKIETDHREPYIAIETRDISNRTTAFSAYNYQSGECLFKEITVEDSWFWSLDRISNGMFFLHSYVHESNPQHKGIIAINQSGEVAWQQFNKALHEVTAGGIIVYNPNIQPKTFELLCAIDGSVISAKIGTFDPVIRNIITPAFIDDDSLIKHLIPANTQGPIFHCSFNDHEIVAYHTQNATLFDQTLRIFKDNTLLLEVNLALGIQKLNPEAFFIEGGQLFCIRNMKQELVSYLV